MCIKENEAAAGGDVGSFDFEHFKLHFITGTRGALLLLTYTRTWRINHTRFLSGASLLFSTS
jgi:hypothetical protein